MKKESTNYQEMTYGEWCSAQMEKPFCLVPGGLLYHAPIDVYLSEYEEIELMSTDTKVYVLNG